MGVATLHRPCELPSLQVLQASNNCAGLVDSLSLRVGKGAYLLRTRTKMKSSFEAMLREFVGIDTIVKL